MQNAWFLGNSCYLLHATVGLPALSFSQASHSETCLRINPHGSVKLKLEPDSLRKHQVKAVKVNARLLDVD